MSSNDWINDGSYIPAVIGHDLEFCKELYMFVL